MWWCGSITFGVCARADRMALWKTLNNYVLFTMACKILCNTSTRVYKIQVKFSLGSDPLEGWKKKCTQFSSQCSTISVIAWLFGRFPGFARLSYWYEQHVDVQYGALVELYWTGGKENYSEKHLSQCDFVQQKIPYGLARDRTRASALRGRRLTAWAMARPQKT